MTIKRQKISKNVTRTTNMKTGTTRYTHSIKTGATTRSSTSHNSKGNTRRTTTSNVGGVVSRSQTSSSPKKYKSSSTRSSSRRRKSSKMDDTITVWAFILLAVGYIIYWIVEWFTANPIYFILLCVFSAIAILYWVFKK